MSELIDNRARRIATLKEIIQHLHKGEAPEAVRNQLWQIVQQTDACEIMAMEQELISGGMPVEEVRSTCDPHSQVTREVLVQLPVRPIAPGHPIDTFKRENAALRQVIGRLRSIMTETASFDDTADCSPQLFQLRQGANELMDVDKHYQRKEHVLFSLLEKHGITGLSKVMWAKDDEIRAMLKRFNQAARDCAASAAACKQVYTHYADPAIAAVEEMIFMVGSLSVGVALRRFAQLELHSSAIQSVASDVEDSVIAGARVFQRRAGGQFDQLFFGIMTAQLGIELIADVGWRVGHRVGHT